MNVRGYDVIELASFTQEKLGDKWGEIFMRAGLPLSPNSNSWYPVPAFCDVLEGIAKALALEPTVIAWETGRYSADKAASGPHRLLFFFASPTFIVKRTNTLWGFYHDFGKIIVTPDGASAVRFCLAGCPDLPELYRHNIAGWVERALELSGARDVKVDLLPREEDLLPFHASWR
ncbi:MAG: hypothetical protein ACP5QG_05040 [candidate division WOR-3 bacterium]